MLEEWDVQGPRPANPDSQIQIGTHPIQIGTCQILSGHFQIENFLSGAIGLSGPDRIIQIGIAFNHPDSGGVGGVQVHIFWGIGEDGDYTNQDPVSHI